MYVVGTAGHVDHGKSTLVKALTGIDPDRLQEEKDRGMTIDLGFAWLRLPSGQEVSIVDVPGHERFIKNMLAGVGGIDLALLVIAADEGIMPQTEEHLAILELLRVKRAVVALTKRDLVDDDWLALVTEDVRARLGYSSLAHPSADSGAGSAGEIPIVVVSAVTGYGIPELLTTLDRELEHTTAREDHGRPRLPIDRVFTIAGFGTVATGTLVGGKLHLGQELEIQPDGHKTRARGLQMHRQKVETALPGTRVAVNLAGLATTDLSRGQIVTIPGWLQPTLAADVSLQVLKGVAPLVHNAVVTFHSGSAEAPARVFLLDGDRIEPCQTGLAQIRLDEPVALAKGDLFVVRGSNETVGGGEVIEPRARRHRRRQAPLLAALRLLQQGTPEELVLQAADQPTGVVDQQTILQRSGLPAEQARQTIAALLADGRLLPVGDQYATLAGRDRLANRVTSYLASYHQQFPLRAGMPREELRSRVGLPTRLANLVLDSLAAAGQVTLGEATARLPDHQPTFSPAQETKVEWLLGALGRDRYSPPSLAKLSSETRLEPELVGALLEQHRIVRVAEGIYYLPDAYDAMVGGITGRLREAGSITVGEVRDLFNTSRKYSLAIMEHLDEQRITRRVGDTRVLR